MLVCVYAIADGVNEEEYREPELGAEYCNQEPEVPNREQELPEDGKFNLILCDNPPWKIPYYRLNQSSLVIKR
jgi:hypothetical protein